MDKFILFALEVLSGAITYAKTEIKKTNNIKAKLVTPIKFFLKSKNFLVSGSID
tara:strand:- start:4099 stop:4260 length:162 start_codon:yes stop_codon:yes gene_type:complete